MDYKRLDKIAASIILRAGSDFGTDSRTFTECALDILNTSPEKRPAKERRALADRIRQTLAAHEADTIQKTETAYRAWLAAQPKPAQVNRFASLPYPTEPGNVSGWITRNPRPGCPAQFVAFNDSTKQVVGLYESDLWTLREWVSNVLRQRRGLS